MTVLNTEERLGMTVAAQLPRVNLLPPEIAEKVMIRKVQSGLGACVLGAVGVVALLAVSASHGVSSAQTSLDSANAQRSTLQRQTAEYSNVTTIYNQAAAAQAQLVTAMGTEVRYSQLMHDLSLAVPSTVWLKGMTYTQTPPAGAAGAATTVTAAGATASTASAGAAATAPIGTVTFTGVGFSHDDLALWLEAVASIKSYTNVYFSNSTENLLGPRKIVTFTSSADLTPAAYSGRYNKVGN